MRDKGAVGADLYVEDSPENVEKLREGGHDTIVFSNSTNRHLEDPRAETWEQVLELVMQRLQAWQADRAQNTLAGQ